MKLVYLALAGAAGTLCRFWMTEGAKAVFHGSIPWGTWGVNILGSLLFGFVWVLAEEGRLVSAEMRLYVLVGFMGAFTTFSTFAFESVDLYRAGEFAAVLCNVLGQNIAGFTAVFAGMALGRVLAA